MPGEPAVVSTDPETPPATRPGGPPLRRSARRWTPRQDRYLQAWWGLRPDAELAGALGRTVAACVLRAKRALGLKRKDNLLTGRQVGAIFGVDPTATYRAWRRRGWVSPTKSTVGTGGHTTAWTFSGADLVRFVREYPRVYDVARMQPGHWLTDLARAVQAEDPWLTAEQAAPLACVVRGAIVDWCAKGWLPSRRRPRYGQSGGARGGRFVVRRSDLLAFLATLTERETANRGRAVRAWQARRRRRRQGAAA